MDDVLDRSAAARNTINVNDNAMQKLSKIWPGTLRRISLKDVKMRVVYLIYLIYVSHLTGLLEFVMCIYNLSGDFTYSSRHSKMPATCFTTLLRCKLQHTQPRKMLPLLHIHNLFSSNKCLQHVLQHCCVARDRVKLHVHLTSTRGTRV